MTRLGLLQRPATSVPRQPLHTHTVCSLSHALPACSRRVPDRVQVHERRAAGAVGAVGRRPDRGGGHQPAPRAVQGKQSLYVKLLLMGLGSSGSAEEAGSAAPHVLTCPCLPPSRPSCAPLLPSSSLQAAILDVPFVDVLSTMQDPSLPLTVAEYDEWGDPSADAVRRPVGRPDGHAHACLHASRASLAIAVRAARAQLTPRAAHSTLLRTPTPTMHSIGRRRIPTSPPTPP